MVVKAGIGDQGLGSRSGSDTNDSNPGVDDEQPARERLKQLLGAHADVEVVGEAEDGVQAAETIAELSPDLVLLDIQMPGASGLDVAASLGKPRPAVIFCTATINTRSMRSNFGPRLFVQAGQSGAARRRTRSSALRLRQGDGTDRALES